MKLCCARFALSLVSAAMLVGFAGTMVTAEPQTKQKGQKMVDGVKSAAKSINIGEVAPDFTLTDTDGKSHTLSNFIKEEPTVNVTVTGFNSYRFIVAGNVNHTGSFTQKFFVTVSEAVAMAGGVNKFAGDQIVLLRTDDKGKLREIPISYKLITSGRHPEMDLAVVAGDTILVQ